MKYYSSFVFVALMLVGCGEVKVETNNSELPSTQSQKTAPTIDNHSAVILNRSESIVPINFNNRGGEITSCSVAPALPSGLNLSNDCSISGTPTVNQSLKTYTVTGKNAHGQDSATIEIEVVTLDETVIKLKGTITYDSVPVNANGIGLDYGQTKQKRVRGAVVRIVNASGQELGRTTTDAEGYYEFTNVKDIADKVKVQVLSKLKSSNWDFEVKDNTNGDALYVMEGSLASTSKTHTQTRNLNASSGWGGSSYVSTRTAAPFAILDVVYQAVQKVRSADSSIVFPPLNIFWSKNNKSASGEISNGDIGTSYYNGDSSFYILGDENSDTDEYDSGVVAHEWGHYYETKFSRSDNIGGSHGGGELLDIRLAFGEGFGNAISSMIRDNPNYWDSSGRRQANGWSMDLESERPDTPGWFSEASIQRILYDIYDSHNDTGDTISYGFKPIHKLLIGKEKNTPAFTSIFTFIKGLKDEHPSDATAIDSILAQESIAPITDIYGTGRTNRPENANPLYDVLSMGNDVTISTNYAVDRYLSERDRTNQLGAYNFLKVTVPSEGDYTISVTQVGNSGSPDPDFYLYKSGSNQPIAMAENPPALSDSLTTHLKAGTYRMAVVVYNQYTGTSYNVKLVKN